MNELVDDELKESVFNSLTSERVDHARCRSTEQARTDIVNWIEGFYNRRGLRSTIGYRTPMQFEQQLIAAKTVYEKSR